MIARNPHIARTDKFNATTGPSGPRTVATSGAWSVSGISGSVVQALRALIAQVVVSMDIFRDIRDAGQSPRLGESLQQVQRQDMIAAVQAALLQHRYSYSTSTVTPCQWH